MSVAVTTGSRAYDVLVGPGVLDHVGSVVSALTAARRAVIVTDDVVKDLYADRVARSLETAGIEQAVVPIASGERSKTWAVAGTVVEGLAAAGLERTDVVVVLGGGVVGDVGGFCASVYMRGVPFVQAPTTLLAQVDASIGGKTGVDLAAGKNLAGTFWQPIGVLADTDVLSTLPEVEWRSGLAEVAKTALLAGGDALKAVEEDSTALCARDSAATERAVAMCAGFKAGVVSADEREAGKRECLNLGHTLGHAIENVAGYGTVAHGVAVAEGIRFAARLARSLLEADESFTRRQGELLDALGLSDSPSPLPVGKLLRAMTADKKTREGRVRFVLLGAPGEWDVVSVDASMLEGILRAWVSTWGERLRFTS